MKNLMCLFASLVCSVCFGQVVTVDVVPLKAGVDVAYHEIKVGEPDQVFGVFNLTVKGAEGKPLTGLAFSFSSNNQLINLSPAVSSDLVGFKIIAPDGEMAGPVNAGIGGRSGCIFWFDCSFPTGQTVPYVILGQVKHVGLLNPVELHLRAFRLGTGEWRYITPASLGKERMNLPGLTVAVSPSTPQSVSPSDASVVARFQVTAKSVRPGSQMFWTGWQLEFDLSDGEVCSLGTIKVLNGASEVVREQVIKTYGNTARHGQVELVDWSNSYPLKEAETLTVVCSTSALAGRSVRITSVTFLATDMGSSNPNGDLLSSTSGNVSTMIRVEQPITTVVPVAPPSGGGGGNGVPVVTTPPEPRPPSELPGREIALQEAPWYRRGPLPAGGNGWWCFVRLTEPLPENSVVWWDSNWSGQYPVPVVGVRGTLIGFPLVYNLGNLPEERLEVIGRFVFSNSPTRRFGFVGITRRFRQQ